jgi:hypothetical protein
MPLPLLSDRARQPARVQLGAFSTRLPRRVNNVEPDIPRTSSDQDRVLNVYREPRLPKSGQRLAIFAQQDTVVPPVKHPAQKAGATPGTLSTRRPRRVNHARPDRSRNRLDLNCASHAQREPGRAKLGQLLAILAQPDILVPKLMNAHRAKPQRSRLSPDLDSALNAQREPRLPFRELLLACAIKVTTGMHRREDASRVREIRTKKALAIRCRVSRVRLARSRIRATPIA